MITPTPVLFRMDDGQVVAVFPDVPGTGDPNTMACFSHVGQHSSCTQEWLQTTTPAWSSDYAALKAELESPPYEYTLKVRQRQTKADALERLYLTKGDTGQ